MIDLIDKDFNQSPQTSPVPTSPVLLLEIKLVTLLQLVQATCSYSAITQIWMPVSIQTSWELIVRELLP